MALIRRERPGYGVIASELVTDERIAGTGRFLTLVDPVALPGHAHVATVAHLDGLSIAIGIHSTQHEVVVFVRGDRSNSQVRKVFHLAPLVDGVDAHQFLVEFANFQIHQASVDGTPLKELNQIAG